MSSQALSNLDDQAVLRVLSQAAAELRAKLPEDQRQQLRGPIEVGKALGQLLDQQGVAHGPIALNGFAAPGTAREVLGTMLADAQTRAVVEPLVARPPSAEKSVEVAAAGAVVLASLVAWLQSTVEIGVERAGGKAEFSFKPRQGAGEGAVKEAATRVGSLLPGKA